MIEMYVDVRSHHFRVYNFTDRARRALSKYSWTFVHWSLERRGRSYVKTPVKTFAASNHARSEYRFHINALKDFIRFMANEHFGENQIDFSRIENHPIAHVEIPIKKGWVPRGDQPAAIDFVMGDTHGNSRVVLLDPGKGKSFLTMYATSQLKQRFVLVTKAGYLEKWLLDIYKTYDIPKEEAVIIAGSKSLMRIISMAKSQEPLPKVLLFSNKTLLYYIKMYEQMGAEILKIGYDATPDELFGLMGGGYRHIDELHQEFHFNFKLDLYTHTSRVLGLSGTFISDDAHITRMHDLAYPIRDRFQGSTYIPYIRTVAVLYNFKSMQGIRYMNAAGKGYSHIVFEQTLIRQKERLQNYMAMIYDHVVDYFVNNKERKKGDRFIVFCATIEMCTLLTGYISLRLRSKDIEVLRYCEDDPYTHLMEPEGRVSTLQSAGTAVDIPQLTHVFLSTAVDSSPSNIQGHGRLRELSDGRHPTFVYFSCADIEQHMKYHAKKKDFIRNRSFSFNEMNFGRYL